MVQRVAVTPVDEGAWWRVSFAGPKGNVLDAETMTALAATFRDACTHPDLKALIVEGAGSHFSYGASIDEHLPGEIEAMLHRFRDLLIAAVECPVPLLAAVRGHCLGGGLELVALADRIFAAPDAQFGQPEISLGVFAPAASILLPLRIRRADAHDLCLTGRVVDADEAQALGLVDDISSDPGEAALAWARTHWTMKSASSLRFAVRALRLDLGRRLRNDLPVIEKIYLSELMRTADAVEGLKAFLDKRPPRWTNR